MGIFQLFRWLIAAKLAEVAAIPGLVLAVVGAIAYRRGHRRVGGAVGALGAVLLGLAIAALVVAWWR